MTRSDNPFGDLPEWKERQRLQEVQRDSVDQPGVYQPAHDAGYAAAPQSPYQNPYPQHGAPATGAGYPDQYGNAAGTVPEPQFQDHPQTAPPLHYNVPANGGPTGHPQGYDPHQQPAYDPHTQVTYPANIQAPAPAPYHEAPPPHAYDTAQVQPGLDGLGMREGHYDDTARQAGGDMYQQQPIANPSYPAQGYDLNNYAPGQPTAPHGGAAPAYFDPNVRPGVDLGAEWDANQPPAAGQLPQGHGEEFDEDEDDYYDDDDDSQRYSWKLLAAVVVTGAVVTGGGVVLYDSFAGGGLGKGGETPIIRANQGPAKTAPADEGGRKFAHRDSKLLGRLDTTGGSKTTGAVDSESGNRVRTVPTVRIGRDGQLILPKAPEVVTSPTPASPSNAQAAPIGGQRIAPGINVVESFNGTPSSGLGTLPPVTPKSETPAATPPAPDQTPKRVASVRPLNAQPAAPVIKNRGAANLATAPKDGLPPVPSKSSLGSAWRMTGTQAAAQKQPNVGGAIRPTIAQPVQIPVQTRSPAPSHTASTLGARAVAQGQARGYVAVLATAPSRMKALQSFAELQQQHPDALLNKVPDVQKADLTARGLGIMYRVVVGPAGPRGSANAVCTSLKAEGYKGCWVKAN